MYSAIGGAERDSASCCFGLGLALRAMGRLAESERSYRRAIGLFSAVPGTEEVRASCMGHLAGVVEAQGRAAEAEELRRQARSM